MKEIHCSNVEELRVVVSEFDPTKIVAADDPRSMRIGWILFNEISDEEIYVSINLTYAENTIGYNYRDVISDLRKELNNWHNRPLRVQSESVLWPL